MDKIVERYLKLAKNREENDLWAKGHMMLATIFALLPLFFLQVVLPDFLREGFKPYSVKIYIVTYGVIFFIAGVFFLMSYLSKNKLKNTPDVIRVIYPGWGKFAVFTFGRPPMIERGTSINIEDYNSPKLPIIYNRREVEFPRTIRGIPTMAEVKVLGEKASIRMETTVIIRFVGKAKSLEFYVGYGHNKEAQQEFINKIHGAVNRNFSYYFDNDFSKERDIFLEKYNGFSNGEQMDKKRKVQSIIEGTFRSIKERFEGKNIKIKFSVVSRDLRTVAEIEAEVEIQTISPSVKNIYIQP